MGALFWFLLGAAVGAFLTAVILCSFFVAAGADEQAERMAHDDA